MRLLLILCFLFSLNTFSQEDIVAREYFKNGEFEKALMSYKKLYTKNLKNRNYLIQLVKTHQQLEQYKEAEATYKITTLVNYPPVFSRVGL